MMRRRTGLLWASAAAAPWVGRAAWAQAPRPVVLATPGPGSSVSLIPELAVKIGADRAEGLAWRLKFTGGGGVAIREIHSGNAQFGVFGLSAAMHDNLEALRLVALAAVEDRVPLTLLVRRELQDRIRAVADLRGRAVGVHSNSLSTVTNSQHFLYLLLKRADLPREAVRLVAAGQSWESQAAALRSGLADALMSEEPFGLRLEQEGLAQALLRLGLPDKPLGVPGEGFLRGTLIAPAALPATDPDLAERMVRTVRRTLAWRREQGPPQVVAALGLAGNEALSVLAMLQRYPRQFSADGRFSDAQLAQTEAFFRAGADPSPAVERLRIGTMVVDRWAGRAP